MKYLLRISLLLLICTGKLCAQSLSALDSWITNGRVYNMTRGEGKIFATGEFNWIGPPHPTSMIVVNSNLAHDSGYPKVETNYMEEAISDDAGGWYALNGSWGVLHIKADKTIEELPVQITDGNILATLLKVGNILYIGGGFSQLNGTTRNNIAAFNLTTNTLTSWNPNSNGYVYSFAAAGSTIYAGGNFTTIGGQARQKIAALDATTGLASSWNPNVATGAGLVSSIIVNGSSIYFSGLFSNVGSGIPTRRHFAAVNNTTGALLTLNPRPDEYTHSMILDGNILYICGKFSQIAGVSRPMIAAFDVTTGVATSFAPTVDYDVNALAVDGQKLIVGGEFTFINNTLQPRIAVVNKVTGVLEATEDRKVNGRVDVLTMSSGKLLVGGSFGGISGIVNNSGVMAFDETTGEGINWQAAAPGPPTGEYFYSNEAEYHNGRVYYRMNVSDGTAMIGALSPADGTAIASWSVTVNGHIADWAFADNALYLAGEFTTVNGSTRNNFAAVNLTTGALLPWIPSPAPSYASGDEIYSIAVHDNVFYATGEFSFTHSSVERRNIGAWNATTGAISTWAMQETPGGYTQMLLGDITDSHVYIMGDAAFRISTSTALVDQDWQVEFEDYVYVSCMTLRGNSVFLGGSFSPGLKQVTTTTGALTGSQPDIDDVYESEGEIMALAISSDRLFVGGNFTYSVNGKYRLYFAQFSFNGNSAPEIQSTVQAFPIGDVARISLTELISDLDDNLDLSTLEVISNPTSGAPASIEETTLIIDYSNTPFSGKDHVTIGVCDTQGACAEQELEVELIGSVQVYNGLSPNGDEKNAIFEIRHINSLPDAQDNRVTIYNRWGDLMFEISNYNNDDRVFRGLSNNGNELATGTYYYKIEYTSGRKTDTGYLYIKK